MKKTKLLIVLIALLLIPFISVKALNKKILTLDVTEPSTGGLKVSGTAEDGTLAVAIQVYDEKEEKLITLQTTSVTTSNTFSDTIAVAKGTYVVKVADYDGGDYLTKKMTVKKSSPGIESPKTYDGVILFVVIALIGTLGIVGSIKYLKKNK